VDLRRAASRWIADGKAQGWSKRTIKDREQIMGRFAWWLETVEEVPAALGSLSPVRVRIFLAYLRDPCPGGRWGTGHPATRRETRPSTVATYHRAIRAFANFCLAEGLLAETPLKNVKPPRVPLDQVQPFSKDQVQALVDAARRGRAPERDVAIVLLAVDTGLRASELCGLTVGDADRGTGDLTVLGKGNKKRRCYMGLAARRAIWRYLEADRRDALPGEPLFISWGGHRAGGALTPSGLFRIVQQLGKAAHIQGVRCSPHTLRHTFAVNFLRGGGNLFELQQLMGHTDLTVLRRYVQLAETDLAEAHRQASPADRMRLR
jgi:site-specific recombinase XerD